MKRWFVVFACLAAPAVPPSLAAAPTEPLRVYAAASLTEAFGELGQSFERSHVGVRVECVFEGSQQIAAQLEQGAPGDVFASADGRWMDDVSSHALLAGAPVTLTTNRLVVIAPATNPARLARLADLARPGVKLVIGADAVPVGHYARQMLANLARAEGSPPRFVERVLANVVSQEENVKSVVGKVQLGEADAGIVFRSDVTPGVARYLRRFDVPDSSNVVAVYPIAALAGSRQPELAAEFLRLATGPEGEAILARHGFGASRPLPAR